MAYFHLRLDSEGGHLGMITVDLIGRVRREHARDKSNRAIARMFRLSRDTVAKYLKSGETEARYERKQQPYPRLGPYLEALDKLLEENEKRPTKDRLDKLQIFSAMVSQGYDGGYDSVRRYVGRWQKRRPAKGGEKAFVPLIYAPGDAYQFDWSEDWAFLSGELVKLQVAHMRLCHSRMPFVRAYIRQTQEMLFDAHEKGFAFFGGIPERGIYDNMKTAVDAVYVGKERKFNRRFSQMCSHYLVEPVACSPAAGWEKGQVENQVGTLRRRLFTPRPTAKTLEERNARLEAECVAHAKTKPHPDFSDRTVWEVFEEERPRLAPVPTPFDGYREKTVSASSTCLIRFDRNRYSVEAKAAGKPVQVWTYADRIVVRLDGEIVAEHQRAFGRSCTITDFRHYIPVVARKPGALRNGLPFGPDALPPVLTELRERLGRSNDADRQFAGILAATLTESLEAVMAACRQALDEGPCSKDVILTILARQKEVPPPPPLLTAPVLSIMPLADCARYDRLLPSSQEAAHVAF